MAWWFEIEEMNSTVKETDLSSFDVCLTDGWIDLLSTNSVWTSSRPTLSLAIRRWIDGKFSFDGQ